MFDGVKGRIFLAHEYENNDPKNVDVDAIDFTWNVFTDYKWIRKRMPVENTSEVTHQ